MGRSYAGRSFRAAEGHLESGRMVQTIVPANARGVMVHAILMAENVVGQHARGEGWDFGN